MRRDHERHHPGGQDGVAHRRDRREVGVRYAADLPDEPFASSAAFEPSYTVVNARVAYAVTEDAELYLRAENLTDAQYQTVEGYATADQSFYFGLTGRF